MNTKKETYEIKNGPNRDTLFDACKYVNNEHVDLAVDFTVAVADVRASKNHSHVFLPMFISDVRITGIEHADNSEHKFILHGTCRADLMPSMSVDVALFKAYHFDADYDAKSRNGLISFY